MKQSLLARILVPLLVLGAALFINYKVSSFYVPAKIAFHRYCDEHDLDYSYYIWVEGKSRLGYSYVDFAPEWGTAPATYRAIVPWIGSPFVETMKNPTKSARAKQAASPQKVNGYFQNMFTSDTPNRMRRLDYMESKLGIQRYDFKFSFPRDQKLIATLKVEAEGKTLNADLPTTYVITPSENAQMPEQRISICFFSPAPPVGSAEQTVCDVSMNDKMNFSFRIPRDAMTPTDGTQIRQDVLKTLEMGKDYTAWSYVVYGEGKRIKLECTLTIRVEPLEEKDEVGTVKKTK